MYLDRTFAQRIGSAKVKSENEVTQYLSTEVVSIIFLSLYLFYHESGHSFLRAAEFWAELWNLPVFCIIFTLPHNFAEFSDGWRLLLSSNLDPSFRSILTKLPVFLNRRTTSAISETPLQCKNILMVRWGIIVYWLNNDIQRSDRCCHTLNIQKVLHKAFFCRYQV